MEFLVTVPLLILDDLGMRKLPFTAAEELLEIILRPRVLSSSGCEQRQKTSRWRTVPFRNYGDLPGSDTVNLG
jgi:hypothetical protein